MPYTQSQLNQHVKNLQTFLRVLSRQEKFIPDIAVDGIYGPETTRAVRAYQVIRSLPATGDVDRQTWDALTTDYNIYALQNQIRVPFDPIKISFLPLKQGMTVSSVRIIQVIIDDLHESTNGLIKQEINGVYDELTKKNIEILQRIFGLKVTGEIDNNTLNKLYDYANKILK